MNETERIIRDISILLIEEKLISHYSVRSIALYMEISHTILYSMINNDKLSVKLLKFIKRHHLLKNVEISTEYILDRIL